jgi:hypothetical protein
LYTLAIAYTNRLEKKQLKKVYHTYLDETSKILGDKRWINWGMPSNYIEYCILWIFQQNPTCRIFFKGETEVDYKVKTCIFEVEIDDTKLKLSTPPFGSIRILNDGIDNNNNNNNNNKINKIRTLSLEWSMSTELDESNSLKPIPKELQLHVHSIFMKKDGDWNIKLNDHNLKKGDQLPWKKIEITEVTGEYITFRINTPHETIQQKVGCNERYVVSYV